MINLNNQVPLAPLGERSPIVRFSSGDLRRAYYYTNACVFLFIFLLFCFVRLEQWRYQEQRARGIDAGREVITLYYAQLGPPPSILGSDEESMALPEAQPSRRAIGVPKPVPDSQALVETSLDQTLISGTPVKLPVEFQGTVVTPLDTFVVPYYKVEVKPQPIHIPTPSYPELARRTGIQGNAVVLALVDFDGSILRVQISKSSGNQMLDQAALAAAKQAMFTPAKQRDRFVRVWVSIPIRFYLKDGS